MTSEALIGVPEGSREFVIAHALHLAARLADFCVAREDDRKARIPELILAAAKTGLEEAGLASLGTVAQTPFHRVMTATVPRGGAD